MLGNSWCCESSSSSTRVIFTPCLQLRKENAKRFRFTDLSSSRLFIPLQFLPLSWKGSHEVEVCHAKKPTHTEIHLKLASSLFCLHIRGRGTVVRLNTDMHFYIAWFEQLSFTGQFTNTFVLSLILLNWRSRIPQKHLRICGIRMISKCCYPIQSLWRKASVSTLYPMAVDESGRKERSLEN